MLAFLLANEDGTFSQQLLHLFTNPAHVVFELGMEFITGVLVYPVGKFFWRKAVIKHDKEHHQHEC
jgi:hypothetical protein